jgi:hypothetical protein
MTPMPKRQLQGFVRKASLEAELLETITVHSGYDFLNGWARKYDLDHERFSVFFGTIELLDWIHGTDGRGRAKKVQ